MRDIDAKDMSPEQYGRALQRLAELRPHMVMRSSLMDNGRFNLWAFWKINELPLDAFKSATKRIAHHLVVRL